MTKIRIGIMGCANIAVRSIMPELAVHPLFELAAVASRTAEKALPVATRYGCRLCTYAELVEDPSIDAVYIPLPTGLHYEWVMKALEERKHVLCEKSLACSLDDVRKIVEFARLQKCLVMENFQFRFHSQLAFVKELLASNRIGEVRCFRASFGFPPFADGLANIRYQKALGGGALLDAGAYTLKASSLFLGPDISVKASHLSYSQDLGVDLQGSAYLLRTDGLCSEVAFGFDHYYQCGYEIWGSQGKITTKRAFTAPPGFEPDIVLETQGKQEVIKAKADNHFSNMLTYFGTLLASGDYEKEYQECMCQARLIQEVRDRAIP